MSGAAGGADPAALAEEGDQEVMSAAGATRPGEAVGQDAAGQILAKLPLGVGGYGITVRFATPCEVQPGLQMTLHRLIRHDPLRPPGLIDCRRDERGEARRQTATVQMVYGSRHGLRLT